MGGIKKIAKVKELLERAINDWPTVNLTDPVSFEKEVKDFIGNPTLLKNIKSFNENMALRERHDSWKYESLASVLEALNIAEIDSLEELVNKLKEIN